VWGVVQKGLTLTCLGEHCRELQDSVKNGESLDQMNFC
jgi:hypothetical protein